MALDLDLVCFPGCSIIRAKPKRAFLIDMSLLRLSAALPKRISTRRPAAGCLQPTMPAASLSLIEVVHFRHRLHPPNGGRTHGEKGEPLLQPRASHLHTRTGSWPAGGRLPFLATKILPARFGGLVARPRLVAILSELPAKRLAVIKAPAGFGKTSLTAACAEKLEQA